MSQRKGYNHLLEEKHNPFPQTCRVSVRAGGPGFESRQHAGKGRPAHSWLEPDSSPGPSVLWAG